MIKVPANDKQQSLKEEDLRSILPCGPAIKNLPSMLETQVRSLGWEDPLEKEMASHSSILAWKIPWLKEPGGL